MGTTKTTQMKNYVPRRMYRERGQLAARQHLGILEKKKDFQKRAKDFKQKTNVIKNLSMKAQMRNPDEFYHKMRNMRKKEDTGEIQFLSGGLNTKNKQEKVDQAKQRKIHENQDIALVNMRVKIEAKKAERIQKNLHLIDFEKADTRIQFVSDISQIKDAKI